MNGRALSGAQLAVFVLVIAALVGVEAGILLRERDDEPYYTRADRKAGEMVDQLLFTDSADRFRTGEMKHVDLVTGDDGPARVTLDHKAEKGFPRDGTWTSPQTQTKFPFMEMVPSWNVATPADTGVIFHVRTRDRATGEWSPWLRIGAWGRVTDKSRRDECAFGKIDTDTLFLNRPADAYQIRATLQSFVFSLDTSPSIRRIAVAYSGPANSDSIWARAMHPDPGPVDRWAKSLDIPFFAQGDNEDAVTGMTCSPTSVSMVLHYWKVNRPPMENCLAIWDDHDALFGNWSNAVQRAAEVGMDSWLQRFRNWDQVKELIAQGQPVVASIEFAKGTFDDAPLYKSTGGHLIVIRGFTRDGNVIVNDPARRNGGKAAIYPARGLGHAWFGHGGVGYVIRPPAKPLPASLVKAPPTTAPTPAASAAAPPTIARD